MNVFFASPQQDVGHGRSHNYDTNSIILVGLKVHQNGLICRHCHLPSLSFAVIVICRLCIPSFWLLTNTILIILTLTSNMERFWKLAQEQLAV